MKRIGSKFCLIGCFACIFTFNSFANDPLCSSNPKKGEWTWLFKDGSTSAWHGVKSDDFPEHGWVVEDGVLKVVPEPGDHAPGSDIVTHEKYGSFELELEINLTEGANSGIKYQVTDEFPGNEGNYLGLEYQLLDNENHPDAQRGRNGNHKMGALYDMIPPPDDILIHPPGQWNRVRIVVDGNRIEHWLNGQKLLECNRMDSAFEELVRMSKYNNLENFGQLDEGHILLQGHGSRVSFRNIRIREW